MPLPSRHLPGMPWLARQIPGEAWVAATVLVAVLMLAAGRYGFHRDELYFIEGGHHLDWAQPDNPITVPLLAAAWHAVWGGNLVGFRILPALVAAITVLAAAGTSGALGGTRREQVFTAVFMANTSIVVGTGHLFSTTTFDLALTSITVLLLIRAVRAPDRLGRWVGLGLAAGATLEIKVLVAMVLASCLIGLIVCGPRGVLRRPGPYLAGALAALVAAPNLVWQARHGWPMLTVAADIAGGGSASSASRALVVPLHLLMAGPLVSVVLIVGLLAPFRVQELQAARWIPVSYLVMLVLVVVTGGKPYYLAGFFAAALALGAGPVLRFLGRSSARQVVAVGVMVAGAAPTLAFSLPLAPIGSPIFRVAQAVNPDGAETVGWASLVATVGRVVTSTPDLERPVIVTRNYGEAGALSRARRLHPELGLPPVYSGHNAYAEWGPPPAGAATVVLVGRFGEGDLGRWFETCTVAEIFTSPPGVDNEEDGALVRVCRRPRQPWAVLWPEMTHFG